MESGDLHANKEDIDRLNAIAQFTQSGMDANQLIYSSLNISLGKLSIVRMNLH
jgi:hypothetical protein